MSYAHLSQHERYQIQHLHNDNFSARAIGKRIARAASAVLRELRRNADRIGYHTVAAQRRSECRRLVSGSRPRINRSTGSTVQSSLTEGFSPEQIQGSGAVKVS